MTAELYVVVEELEIWLRFTSDEIVTGRGFQVIVGRVYESGTVGSIREDKVWS